MDARMTVLPKKRQELLRLLTTMEERVRREESGCLDYQFSQDQEDEDRIRLTLEWSNQEHFARHLASPQHAILLGAFRVLCQSPVIIFQIVDGR